MEPILKTLKEKKLIGISIEMSLVENKTAELWKTFRSSSGEVQNTISEDFISLQQYSPSHFKNFNPNNRFMKWACVAVANFENIPVEMNTLILSGGLYAVFHYKDSSADSGIFEYIYGKWVPNSDYNLDDRPHFEVLGPKYKNNDPSSEEEIWIPIQPK
jgi:AraC family transcriptional regulator